MLTNPVTSLLTIAVLTTSALLTAADHSTGPLAGKHHHADHDRSRTPERRRESRPTELTSAQKQHFCNEIDTVVGLVRAYDTLPPTVAGVPLLSPAAGIAKLRDLRLDVAAACRPPNITLMRKIDVAIAQLEAIRQRR